MPTALSLIKRSAQLLGVLRKGETLDNDEAQDGLLALNDLLESWSNSTLVVSARTLETLTFATNAAEYTIGPGATLDTARPIKIESMVITSGGTDTPVHLVSEKEFEQIIVKSTEGDPCVATYDYGYPTGKLRFYPTPSAGDVLRLLSEKELSSVAALTTNIDLRPGFARALRYNLAVELAPEYGIQPPAAVIKGAAASLRAITLSAARNRKIRYNSGAASNRTIYTGFNT